ncbi:dihydroneopterin aldolase [Roseibacterium sp. SDUM158017]|uniref:dihydroneopterin aldolase n=1 Tax=Roseicyclus salinarum TaxID=3036773 RepID=UPI0024154994|nr:dihydroneopterin aldolase [Roseibacterium sp. SDUM158017]MDG4648172.1 dihydroneopterin aldolase [Roseibacterium sp. SDUM158017]
MTRRSAIELNDLALVTDIGTYGPGDVVPEAHLLDLVLAIDPSLVLIARDGMAHVFDYDPLIAEIDRLARDGHYQTQERLMTRIAGACARHPEIEGVEIRLRKSPVLAGSGSLGVRLVLDGEGLAALR